MLDSMQGRRKHTLGLASAAMLLALGPAIAGSYGQAFVIDTSGRGVQISCANPHRALGTVRTNSATTVFQAGPAGVRWQFQLPPMATEFDYSWFAPDGGAAVVALSVRAASAKAFLLTGDYLPVEIDGPLMDVDFQPGRVLVASNMLDAGESDATRVRVYDLASGDVLGDSMFADDLAFEVTHDADKQFIVRLSADGRYYYYIRWTRDAGDELVVRDVATGDLEASYDTDINAGTVDAGLRVTNINDALLYADGRGYMVSGGGLFRIDGADFTPIETTPAIGWAAELVESRDGTLQAVVGRNGWGIFDIVGGQWLMNERVRYHMNLRWGDAGLVVIDQSLGAAGLKVYDVSGGQPRLTRSVVDKRLSQHQSLVCINAYGFLAYQDDKQHWTPTAAQP